MLDLGLHQLLFLAQEEIFSQLVFDVSPKSIRKVCPRVGAVVVVVDLESEVLNHLVPLLAELLLLLVLQKGPFVLVQRALRLLKLLVEFLQVTVVFFVQRHVASL